MSGRLLASLACAAVAALALVPWSMAATPVLGFGAAVGLFAAATLGVYLFCIAPDARRGFYAAVLGGLAGGGAWMLLPGSATQLLALLLILGLVRSGWFYRRRPARAIAVELALGSLSLMAAWIFVGSTLLSWALGVWAIGLVQSLYFLVADFEPRRDRAEPDAFDGAHERAMRLLEQTGH